MVKRMGIRLIPRIRYPILNSPINAIVKILYFSFDLCTFDLPPYFVPLPMLGQRRSFVPPEGCGAERSSPQVE